MLALHADHQVALSGQIIVQSLPFDMLTVPLDQAVDTSLSHGSTVHAGSATAGASALTGARAVLNHVYSSQIAEQEALHRHIEHVARLGGASTPAGRAAATAAPARVSAGSRLPGFQSTLAAAALGLTPSQARAFVSAQAAVPTLKGTPHLRSLHDVLRFIAVYNPRSRFRVAQRAAHSNVISSALVRSGTDVGAANDKLWAQLLDGFQRLIEEYIQEMLAHTYEQVRANENGLSLSRETSVAPFFRIRFRLCMHQIKMNRSELCSWRSVVLPACMLICDTFVQPQKRCTPNRRTCT